MHGGRDQWIRHGGTMLALFRLRDKQLLSDGEYARLVAAYQFLRCLEHRLQMDEDRQIHALPQEPDRLAILARKVPAESLGTVLTAETLQQNLADHRTAVTEIYERVIHAQKPLYYTLPEPAVLEEQVEALAPPSSLTRYLDDRAPQLAGAVADSGLHRGRERFEHFLEKAFATDLLDRLN